MSSARMPTRRDRGRIGDVGLDEARRAIVRQVALGDVGDDDLVAVGDQFRGEMAADEAVAAEDDMSH